MSRRCQAHELFARTLPPVPAYPVPEGCDRDAVVTTRMPTLTVGHQLNGPLQEFAVCADHRAEYQAYTGLLIFRKLASDGGTRLLAPTWAPVRE